MNPAAYRTAPDVPGPAEPQPTAEVTVQQLDAQVTADIDALDKMIDRYTSAHSVRVELRRARADLDGLRGVIRSSLAALKAQAKP